jgi:hypothetical protein
MLDQGIKAARSRCCFRCGKELPLGGLIYLVNIRVFAGFDGLLLEPEEGIGHQLKQILQQIEKSEPQELEKEVYEEFTLLLCKSCRDRFVNEAQHPWEGPFQTKKDPDLVIH